MDELPPYSLHDPNSSSSVERRSPVATPRQAARHDSIPPNLYVPPVHRRTASTNSTFISAAPYFEMRPPAVAPPQEVLCYRFVIESEIEPAEIPFPEPEEAWLGRDVEPEDWQSFLNHLVPDHVERRNASIAATSQNETGATALAISQTLAQSPTVPSSSQPHAAFSHTLPLRQASPPIEVVYSETAMDHFQAAQLADQPSRPPKATETEPPEWESEELRREIIEAVIQEWNEGFFSPRGLKVVAELPPAPTHPPMPGDFDFASGSTSRQDGPPAANPLNWVPQLQAWASRFSRDTEAATTPAKPKVLSKTKSGDTALVHAASKGDKQLVNILIETGMDVNETTAKGETPLMKAIERSDKAIVRILLEHGANPNVSFPSGDPLLYKAVNRSEKTIVELLLKYGADPNMSVPGSEPILHKAISRNEKSLVELLLVYGARVHTINKRGETAIQNAVRNSGKEVVNLLLHHGVDPNSCDPSGRPLLTFAIQNGHSKFVKSLLEAGAHVDGRVPNGDYPLIQAITRGDLSAVKTLLDHGANPDSESSTGVAAIWLVLQKSNGDMLKALLAKEASVNVPSASGDTPLLYSVRASNKTFVKGLLEHGADANAVSPAGETSLYLALSGANKDIMALLLAHGADPNAAARNGLHPLHLAVSMSNVDFVKLLLINGCDVNARDHQGSTPLYQAVLSHNHGLVKALLLKGASIEKVTAGLDIFEYAERSGDRELARLLNDARE